MTPRQAHKAVDTLMADSESVTDAVLLLIDHANANGLCLAMALGWLSRLFDSIETRLAHQLMSLDDHEDEVLVPAHPYRGPDPIKPGVNPERN